MLSKGFRRLWSMALLASQWRRSKSISRLITLSSFHPPLKLISKVIFKQDTDVILYSDITRKVVVYVREGWTKKEYVLSPNLLQPVQPLTFASYLCVAGGQPWGERVENCHIPALFILKKSLSNPLNSQKVQKKT